MPGHPDFQGFPPVSQAVASINNNSLSIAAQATVTETGPIIRQGYEIRLLLQNLTNVATLTPVKVEMQWSDAATLIVTGYQRWRVYSGLNSGAHTIIGHGPSNGNTLTLKITNSNAGTPTVQAAVTVLDVARPYLEHDWRTRDDFGPQFGGFTFATSDLAAGVVCQIANHSLATTGSFKVLLPLYAGPATISLLTGSSTGLAQAWVLNEADTDLATDTVIETLYTFGQVTADANIYLPRVQCALEIFNEATTTQPLWCNIIAGR